jgi:hypothetical protein
MHVASSPPPAPEEGDMNTPTTNRPRAPRADGIGPELVLALARQIPTLETDALARLLSPNLPTSTPTSYLP